jgi:hypothetical protein
VVFSGTPVSSTNKTERHDITESGVKHHEPTNLEVSDYCITPNEQIFSISWREQVSSWCLTPLSVISWRSVLLVEETGVPEKTTDLLQVT